jgi:hypothetical protein
VKSFRQGKQIYREKTIYFKVMLDFASLMYNNYHEGKFIAMAEFFFADLPNKKGEINAEAKNAQGLK